MYNNNLATKHFNPHSSKFRGKNHAQVIGFTPHDFTFEDIINGLKLNKSCYEASHLQHIAFKLGFERSRTFETKDYLSFTKTYPLLYCEGTSKKLVGLSFRMFVDLERNEETKQIEWSIRTDVVDSMMRTYAPYYNRSSGQVNLNVEKADKHINKICNKLLNVGLITV